MHSGSAPRPLRPSKSRSLTEWCAAVCVVLPAAAGLVLAPVAHAGGAGMLSADIALNWQNLGLILAFGILLGAAVAGGLAARAARACRHERPSDGAHLHLHDRPDAPVGSQSLATDPARPAQKHPVDAPPLGAEVDTACWTEWLDGWYWQTDAEHRLVQWRPVLRADAATWAQAAEVLAQGPLLHTLVDATEQPRLSGQLQAGGRVDVGALHWADGLGMPDGEGHLLGMPRVSTLGEHLGHHGVWRPIEEPRAVAEASPMAGVRVAERDELAEAAQEALRYALSHDLRAPLRVIDGFARILKEDHAASLDKLARDHIERILAAAHRMNGMIDAVLDQAHLSQAPLQRAEVDLSALALDVAGELITCRPPRADGSLPPEVLLEVTGGMCTQADAVLVRRVFENLIGNAIKYSQKVAQPHITVGAVPHTDPEVYFVKDNGAGFDMKHADKLFGLFQRLHSTREFPGSGVGLASVNNIIRRHGGRVWAEAEPGQGACFYFSLAPFKGGTPRR